MNTRKTYEEQFAYAVRRNYRALEKLGERFIPNFRGVEVAAPVWIDISDTKGIPRVSIYPWRHEDGSLSWIPRHYPGDPIESVQLPMDDAPRFSTLAATIAHLRTALKAAPR